MSGGEDSIIHRTELLEVMKLMEAGYLDGIIYEKLDRLSRDQEFNIRILKTAQKANCAIVQVNKGFIDLKQRSDRLGVTLENVVAEDYRFELQEKVQKKTRAARVNNGKDNSTTPVLGLDPHPTQAGFYVINKEEQKMVTEIFSLFARTSSYDAVVKYCQEKGYRSKTRMTKEKIDKEGNRVAPRMIGGKPITPTIYYDLFKNKKIRGIGRFKDDWEQYPDKQDVNGIVHYKFRHDPVVPPELTVQVDAVLERIAKEHVKYGKFVYLLLVYSSRVTESE